VLEGQNEANSILRTSNSGVTCEPHSYLPLSARCMWTDTHSYVCGKNCTTRMWEREWLWHNYPFIYS